MASVNIPEEIIGVPLFVPSANNFFQIDVGGMPNGDDCLSVLGATSRDHKAFIPAPSLTPDILAQNVPWGLSFWISGPTSGWTQYSIIMSVETSLANTTPYTPTVQRPIVLYTGSTAGQLQFMRSTLNSSSYIFQVTALTIMPGPANWAFIVIDVPPAGQTGYAWNDDGTAPLSSDSQSNPGGAAAADQFLSIGGYANAIGANVDYRIGKLAFHDHHLTQTERLLLYNGMVA
jgi:hypothetical protein